MPRLGVVVRLAALFLLGTFATACPRSVQQHEIPEAGFDVAIPRPGTSGSPCTVAADCNAGVCLPSGACSGTCAGPGDCPSGWSCNASAGVSRCECAPSREACDGVDNDCNGVIDDGLPGCPCADHTETRCGEVCVDLSADRDNCGSCGRHCAANETCASGMCGAARLDLLFMIDNTSTREDQTDLMVQFAPMLHALTTPPCTNAANPTPHACDPGNSSDQQVHPPVTDIHVGVISSDLGTPGSSVPGCANSDLGDDGLLNPIRNGEALLRHEPWLTAPPTFGRPTDCTDPDEFPSFISYVSGTTDPTTFVHDMQCNAGLYVNGCGLESQLEAIYRALIIHDATDRAGNTSPNAGFLRDDAVLAIVLMTDEEDGSVRDCRFANGWPCEGQGAIDVYNPASTDWAAMELNLRAYMYAPCGPQDPTWPVQRYLDTANPAAGLLSLKPGHPERIVFSGIIGVPLQIPTVDVSGERHTDWDGLLGRPGSGGRDDFCGRDSSGLGSLTSAEGPISMMQANADPACAQRVIPACRREGSAYSTGCTLTEQYFAWPARRIVEVARRFDELPVCHGRPCRNGAVYSVCLSNYARPVQDIVARIQARL